ncbi:MAG: hypothetical protein AB1632_15120 [Nitrospirota bacterium]
MATLTAQILIGSPHPNHDGINPTHYLFLSENDRPAWVLVDQNIFQNERSGFTKVTWIPTVENMLEDALLMVVINILKNREIIEMAKGVFGKIESERVELYSNFNESQLNTLYRKCREISDFPKMIISVFRGSTIEKQLAVLEQYKMDVEVCAPIYSRLYSPWTNENRIEGSFQ